MVSWKVVSASGRFLFWYFFNSYQCINNSVFGIPEYNFDIPLLGMLDIIELGFLARASILSSDVIVSPFLLQLIIRLF